VSTEEADDLVAQAQRQLDEHKAWLRSEIGKITVCGPDWSGPEPAWRVLLEQADQIRLRVARVRGTVASVIYEYPDELVAFLRSDLAPPHLRASIAGGHVLDPNQPTFTARREDSEPKS
jgi:hypothetical protein